MLLHGRQARAGDAAKESGEENLFRLAKPYKPFDNAMKALESL